MSKTTSQLRVKLRCKICYKYYKNHLTWSLISKHERKIKSYLSDIIYPRTL